mmetsp:Transcript_105178/g.181359  ORF Transcript_105178/g.181359 Transcript_105178/m.181359 type:complete len:263 (+) Transcript_105178:180-968(+)
MAINTPPGIAPQFSHRMAKNTPCSTKSCVSWRSSHHHPRSMGLELHLQPVAPGVLVEGSLDLRVIDNPLNLLLAVWAPGTVKVLPLSQVLQKCLQVKAFEVVTVCTSHRVADAKEAAGVFKGQLRAGLQHILLHVRAVPLLAQRREVRRDELLRPEFVAQGKHDSMDLKKTVNLREGLLFGLALPHSPPHRQVLLQSDSQLAFAIDGLDNVLSRAAPQEVLQVNERPASVFLLVVIFQGTGGQTLSVDTQSEKTVPAYEPFL